MEQQRHSGLSEKIRRFENNLTHISEKCATKTDVEEIKKQIQENAQDGNALASKVLKNKIALYIIFGAIVFIFMAIVTLIISNYTIEVKDDGFFFGKKELERDLNKSIEDCKRTTIDSCLNGNIQLKQLIHLRKDHFPPNTTKTEAEDIIRNLCIQVDKYNDLKKELPFKIYLLERQVLTEAIDTRHDDHNKIEYFKLIQNILRSINEYDGKLDDRQATTHRAVVDFQNSYNSKYFEKHEKNFFPQKELGIVGRKTVSAIRDLYVIQTGYYRQQVN